MYKPYSIAGLLVSAATRDEIRSEIEHRLTSGTRTRIVTPYSEFLFSSLKNQEIRAMLNSADISIADGIGIVWAARFLSKPFRTSYSASRYIEAIFQVLSTGAQILLTPRQLYREIPEKIVGADFFWDLAAIAAKTKSPIYLLGGFDDTGEIVAQKLKQTIPNIIIAGISNDDYPGSEKLIEQINNSHSKILFLAWGPIRQEQWLCDNIEKLPEVAVCIGLGATFDYISGKKKAPPAAIRKIGLEWLFRLITQPYRYRRIYNATVGLVRELISYKMKTRTQ